jgi:hypothetical protein
MKTALINSDKHIIMILIMILIISISCHRQDIIDNSFVTVIFVDSKEISQIKYTNDSIYIYQNSKRSIYKLAFKGLLYTHDGTIVVDTIYFNIDENAIQIQLIDNRFRRNKTVYYVKCKSNEFYISYIKKMHEIPFDRHFIVVECDTNILMKLPIEPRYFDHVLDKLIICDTSIIEY